eukprot:292768-Chlamydomonas_euryale.AAC.1
MTSADAGSLVGSAAKAKPDPRWLVAGRHARKRKHPLALVVVTIASPVGAIKAAEAPVLT